MNYLLINIIIVFFTFGVCSEFKLGQFYYFEDKKSSGPEGSQRNLFRGQLNIDNSWLSAEMLYDGNASKNKEILLFEFGENPCKPNRGIKFREYLGARKNRMYDGYLVDWSNFEDRELIFSFVHYQTKGDNKGTQFISSDSDYDDEDFPFLIDLPPLSLKETIFGRALNIDKINGYSSVIDYSLLNNEEVEMDAFFISYLDKSKENIIITSYSDFTNKILFNNAKATNEINNPEDIEVQKRGNDFDALVTFKGNHEQDIYYFCNIVSRGGIDPNLNPLAIFPRTLTYRSKDEYVPYKKQLQPSFSSNGDYVGFINQRVQKTSDSQLEESSASNKIFDLYVFNTKDRQEFCRYNHSYDGELEYQLVDSDIVNVFNFELPSETAMDYAWHPDYNVVFYIKREDDSYELKSYNADTKERSVLLRSKHSMGYISISDDGAYIVFSFTKLDKDFENCKNCDNKNVTARKIAVAELIHN